MDDGNRDWRKPRTCIKCGAEFIPYIRKQQHCSRPCGQSNRIRKRPARVCLWCGVTFQPSGYSAVTCSAACGKSAAGLRKLVTHLKWKTCTQCGRAYTTRGGRRCDCSWAGTPRGTTVTAQCVTCGVAFTYPSATRPRVYCSDSCFPGLTPEQKRQAKQRRRARKRSVAYEAFNDREIFERDHWRCHLCGQPVDRTQRVPQPLAATLDHIVPLAKGGGHTRANVACAHFICNTRKGDRPAGEQLRLIG